MADLGLIALLEFTDRLGRFRKQLLVDFLLPIRCAMIHARVRVQNHRQPPPARQHLHGGVMEMVMELSWNCHGITVRGIIAVAVFSYRGGAGAQHRKAGAECQKHPHGPGRMLHSRAAAFQEQDGRCANNPDCGVG